MSIKNRCAYNEAYFVMYLASSSSKHSLLDSVWWFIDHKLRLNEVVLLDNVFIGKGKTVFELNIKFELQS